MGDTHQIKVSFKVDGDGFLRRRCPECSREFKRKHPDGERTTAYNVATIHCPYCGASGSLGDWFTPQQAATIKAAAVAQTPLGDALRKLDRTFENLDRVPGVRVTRRGPPLADRFARPDELPEPDDDMRRAALACHPLEELKIASDWNEAIHCPICGTPA